MKDSNFKRKFFYLLMRELSSKSITFISGKDDVLREFLLNDDKLDKEERKEYLKWHQYIIILKNVVGVKKEL